MQKPMAYISVKLVLLREWVILKLNKIKFKINFEPKLTLFIILKFMLLVSLSTLKKTHGYCCSSQYGMKPLNWLLGSESAVEARKLILSCRTLMMTVMYRRWVKSSVMWCCLTGTTYKERYCDRTSTILESIQFFCCVGQWYIIVYY